VDTDRAVELHQLAHLRAAELQQRAAKPSDGETEEAAGA
jgi:hypothetical protein